LNYDFRYLSVTGFATPLLTFYRLLAYLNVSDGVANPVRLNNSKASFAYMDVGKERKLWTPESAAAGVQSWL
jgi:hypothetical protein